MPGQAAALSALQALEAGRVGLRVPEMIGTTILELREPKGLEVN